MVAELNFERSRDLAAQQAKMKDAMKDWVAKNAGSTGVAAPEVTEGSVFVYLNK